MTIGCVYPRDDTFVMQTKGRDVKTGLAKEIVVQANDAMEAMFPIAKQIAEEVLGVLERSSPELIADVSVNGIVLTGGSSQIWGMDRLLAEVTKIPCVVADDADSCCAYGCGKSLGWIRQMQEGTINIARKKLLKD